MPPKSKSKGPKVSKRLKRGSKSKVSNPNQSVNSYSESESESDSENQRGASGKMMKRAAVDQYVVDNEDFKVLEGDQGEDCDYAALLVYSEEVKNKKGEMYEKSRFFIAQVLQKGRRYYTFFRYGGGEHDEKQGQCRFEGYQSLDEAKKAYNKAVKSKTDHKKTPYDELEIELENVKTGQKSKKKSKKKVKKVSHGCPVDSFVVDSEDFQVIGTKSKIFSTVMELKGVNKKGQETVKYYVCQVLQRLSNGKYYTFWRYGSGDYQEKKGNKTFAGPFTLSAAKEAFDSQVKSKSEKNKDPYEILEIDYDMDDDEESSEEEGRGMTVASKGATDFKESKLDTNVKKATQLMFNMELMQRQLLDQHFDSKQLPVEKLSEEDLAKAMKVLTQISKMVGKTKSKAKVDLSVEDLEKLCMEFYKIVPHTSNYMKKENEMLIDNTSKIMRKVQMVQNLQGIQLANSIIESNSKSENLLDANYTNLNTTLTPLDHKSHEYEVIEKYLNQTHTEQHDFFSLKIIDVLKVEKDGEAKAFQKDLGNRNLLWYGQRLTNWAGTLQNGMQVPSEESPNVLNNQFGRGLYFYDRVSKAANNCFSNDQDNTTGILLLADVALGNAKEMHYTDYYAKDELEEGEHSVKAMGNAFVPEKQEEPVELDGTMVPLGESVKAEKQKGGLMYNEYVVYDTTQVQMKYLVICDFVATD